MDRGRYYERAARNLVKKHGQGLGLYEQAQELLDGSGLFERVKAELDLRRAAYVRIEELETALAFYGADNVDDGGRRAREALTHVSEAGVL